MNYRHIFHAGNFADVVKHIVLCRTILYLARKQAPFAVIDTHAGAGTYDLAGAEAQKTGEAARGIMRVLSAENPPELLEPYLALVRNFVNAVTSLYPGSPLVAVRLLRSHDRLACIERQPEEAAKLRAILAPFRRARVIEGDGYAELKSLIPPPERRGLVLIDPPFEDEDEYEKLIRALRDAHARWPQGAYLVWLPVKDEDNLARFSGELASAAIRDTHMLEWRGEPGLRETALQKSALLLVSPPFALAGEIKTIMPWLMQAMTGSLHAWSYARITSE